MRTQRKEQLTPREQTVVGDGFPEEMLSTYELLDDQWMRRLPGRGREERDGVPGSKE